MFVPERGNAPSGVDHAPLLNEIEAGIDCLVDPYRSDARYRRAPSARNDLHGFVPICDSRSVRCAFGRYDAHSRKKLRFRANASFVPDKEMRARDEIELFDIGVTIRVDPDVAHLRQGESRFHRLCIFVLEGGCAFFCTFRRIRKAGYGRAHVSAIGRVRIWFSASGKSRRVAGVDVPMTDRQADADYGKRREAARSVLTRTDGNRWQNAARPRMETADTA
ncbi:hypothetical protein [Burkholderia anthina]|uniref:hypothetical protein n=1 Tax=Burkholderia anthina TaxID=179879 RepID=UPI00163A2470|nr:hypothetical protein [Burkholderia anthina]